MKLLVSGATKTMANHPECGILVTPHNGNSIRRIAESGRVWAADNSAFGAWDQEKFWRMIGRIANVEQSRLLWVACPDVVANAQETINRWIEWFPQLDYLGIPVAFIGQDGLEELRDQIPWYQFQAFFIGGSTKWKLSEAAGNLGREARARGKLLHVGRVNSEKRIRHMLEIGADTVDGTGFSKWPKRIGLGLKWIRQNQTYQPLF